jgi:hypothetical protein
MAFGAGSGKLNQAFKDLKVRWEETRNRWKDPVGLAFEENHMVPLERQLVMTLRAMDRLAQTMTQAQRDCQP